MNNPKPQGKYVIANRIGDVIITSGMTPRENGVLIMTGEVNGHNPCELYKDAVVLAVSNAYKAAESVLLEGEHIDRAITMTVYINAVDGYATHAQIADFASDFLLEKLGAKGAVSRAAIGVASLPGGAPVEIQLVVAAGR